jgi:hypothetical protein
MKHEGADEVTSDSISIARCRELLGDDAHGLSDRDVDRIRQHARVMADIVVEMFLEGRALTK